MNPVACVVLAFLLNSEPAAIPQKPRDPNVLEEFDIFSDGDLLLLPVRFRGATYQFMLDTGATQGFYDVFFKPALGRPLGEADAGMPSGNLPVTLYNPSDAYLGRLNLRTETSVCALDLSSLRRATGYPVRGFIGMDFLVNTVVQISPDEGKLRVLRRAPANGGTAVPIYLDRRGIPNVELTLPGFPAGVPFVIDTGSVGSTANLEKSRFDWLVRDGHLKPLGNTGSYSLSGTDRKAIGRLSQLTLGEYQHKGLVLTSSSEDRLFLDYLSRYVVTFDFPNRTMYLAKGKRFDRQQANRRFGAVLGAEEGRVVVDAVAAGSPAEQTGIRPKDVLVTIDGQKCSQLRVLQIAMLLNRDQAMSLTVRRGAEQIRVEVPAWTDAAKARK